MSLPAGFVVFADDLRQELFGKISLIGIYAREMVFFGPEPPSQILRVAIATTVRWPTLEDVEPVQIEIYFPPQPDEARPSAILTAEFPRQLLLTPESDPQPGILLAQVFEQVPLAGTGVFRVFVSGPSGRKQIGRLFVRSEEPKNLQAVLTGVPPGVDGEPPAGGQEDNADRRRRRRKKPEHRS